MPSSMLLSAHVAHASPEFPDFSDFVESTQDYSVAVRYYKLTEFSTPGGLQCQITSSRGGDEVTCSGVIPGLDYAARSITATMYTSFITAGVAPPSSGKAMSKPLRSGEKLTYDDRAVCGVREALVACVMIHKIGDGTEQRHGFVVSAEGTWNF